MKFQFVALVALAVMLGFASAVTQWPVGQECINLAVNEAQFGEIYTLRPENLGAQVVFTQTHAAGFDPDLYVRWNQAPNRSEYDYAEMSELTNAKLYVDIDQEHRDDTAQTLYIGVYSYRGTGSVQLCYKNYQCGNRDCNAEKGAGICTAATRTCACNLGWGGINCRLQQKDGTFGTVNAVNIAPNEPVAFKFTATKLAGEIHFEVERPSTVYSDVLIRARRGQMPTPMEFDFEDRVAGFNDNVDVTIDQHAYAPGDWYFTLETTSTTALPFTVSATGYFYDCPNDCSKNGSCAMNNNVPTCTCNSGYSLSDCSFFGTVLHVNSTLPVNLPSYGHLGFHFDVGKNVEDANVELVVRFNANSDCQPHCPTLFIERSVTAKARASKERYLAISKHPITKQQSVTVADANLHSGSYTATIENTHSAPVSGTIEIHFTPHCPNNCSGHGWCSWDGMCTCHDGHHSADCSVTKKICETRLPSRSGLGGFGLFVIIVLALGLGGVAGVFAFKKSATVGSSSPSQQQQVAGADDQYAQLN